MPFVSHRAKLEIKAGTTRRLKRLCSLVAVAFAGRGGRYAVVEGRGSGLGRGGLQRGPGIGLRSGIVTTRCARVSARRVLYKRRPLLRPGRSRVLRELNSQNMPGMSCLWSRRIRRACTKLWRGSS